MMKRGYCGERAADSSVSTLASYSPGKSDEARRLRFEPNGGASNLLSFLDFGMLGRMRLASSEWRIFAQEDSLWIHLASLRWPGECKMTDEPCGPGLKHSAFHNRGSFL